MIGPKMVDEWLPTRFRDWMYIEISGSDFLQTYQGGSCKSFVRLRRGNGKSLSLCLFLWKQSLFSTPCFSLPALSSNRWLIFHIFLFLLSPENSERSELHGWTNISSTLLFLGLIPSSWSSYQWLFGLETLTLVEVWSMFWLLGYMEVRLSRWENESMKSSLS